jgi:hypothetical protein
MCAAKNVDGRYITWFITHMHKQGCCFICVSRSVVRFSHFLYITCGESCLTSARFPNWFPRNITHTTTLTIAGFNLYVISSGRADSAPATGNFVPICFSRPFIVLYYIIYDVEFSTFSTKFFQTHYVLLCAAEMCSSNENAQNKITIRKRKTFRVRLTADRLLLSGESNAIVDCSRGRN